MRVSIKFNHWLPSLLGHDAITIYPWIMTRLPDLSHMGIVLVQHEFIHVRQVRSIGWVKYYFTYLVNQFRFGYAGNPYEIEAYSHQATQLLTDVEIAELGL